MQLQTEPAERLEAAIAEMAQQIVVVQPVKPAQLLPQEEQIAKRKSVLREIHNARVAQEVLSKPATLLVQHGQTELFAQAVKDAWLLPQEG